jgi:DNA repair protein RadD
VGSGNRCPVLQGPTAFGKTRLMGEVFGGALAKGNPAWVVEPMIQLIDQTVASLASDVITEVGVMQADHWMTNCAKPIQVCCAQTLASLHRRGKLLGIEGKPAVVIIDESHK